MQLLPIHLFGQVRIFNPESAEPVRVTHNVQALLAYLMLHRQRSHSREVLAGLLWDDHPQDRARGSMNTTMTAGADFRSAGNGDNLQIWRVIQGEMAIEDVERRAVRFCLLPATLGEYTVTATTLLRTYVEAA